MSRTVVYDIALLTSEALLNPAQPGWYQLQVLLEDELVKSALEAQGLTVTRQAWSDPDFDWRTVRSVLFRTTWDCYDRLAEFQAWYRALPDSVMKLNSGDLIAWNLDKRYLLDLEAKGVAIVPTQVLRAQDGEINLEQLLREKSWEQMVVKPVISGGARRTLRLDSRGAAAEQPRFDQWLQEEDFLLQPFQDSVASFGEVSLMVYGKTPSHAVLKTAKPGDFRVQDDYGGQVQGYQPGVEELAFAQQVIEACPEQPIYSRVDYTMGPEGPMLMELELIEPELFNRFFPRGVMAMACEVATALKA